MLPADVYARYLRAARPRGAATSAPPTSTAPRPSSPPPRPGEPVADYCAEQHEVQKRPRRRLRPVLGLVRPLLLARRTTSSPSTSPAGSRTNGFISRSARPSRSIRPPTAASCPTATSIGTCPHCGYAARPRRPVRELHQRARPHRPDRAPLGDLRLAPTSRSARPSHLYLLPEPKLRRRAPRLDRRPRRDWPALATSIARKWLRRGPAGPRHHPRPRLGRPGPPRRRALARLEGKVFYVWFDAPIEYIGATEEWADAATRRGRDWQRWWRTTTAPTTSATSSSWARTTSPFHTVSFPATILGSRRAVEAGRHAQGLQLAELLRRQVLHLARAAASSWTRRSSSCPPTTGAGT